MDPLSALIGGGLSLVGGIIGQNNQANINAQNIAYAQQAAQNSISWRVADANRAGINPLAALGSNFQPSMPQLVGSDALPNALNQAGQDVSRAGSAYADRAEKYNALNEELLKAQIAKTNAETVTEMARNSQIARTLAAPGSPPTRASVFPPLPRSAPGYASTLPSLTTDYRGPGGQVVTLLSDKASQGSMSAGSAAAWPITNTAVVAGQVGDVWNYTRPDVGRAINNINTDIGTAYDPQTPWVFPQ